VRVVAPLAGRAFACTAIMCTVFAAGCSSGHRSTTHESFPSHPDTTFGALRATSAGYAVPKDLPTKAPGTLISTRDAPTQARLLGAQRAWQILYHSTDLAGRDTAVSGLVLVPPGQPPAGGWPLVAWAHGTSGLADRCAPSIAKDLGNDGSAIREVTALLAQKLAVVASDYPGLGTPGVHTYLIGQANARAVIDSVTAAHVLLRAQVSASWITVGHSEGGQTVLFVAQEADERAPRWKFLGTMALAPASQLNLLVPLAQAGSDPVEQAYLVYALEGLTTVDPNVHVDTLLAPPARALLSDTTSGCIDDITHDFARHPVAHLLAADAATQARLGVLLGRYDNPDHARAAEPILITQGDVDSDVPEVATNALVSQLCARGDHVEYRTYPGLDHNDLIAGSQVLMHSWITQRFAHAAATSTC
jgi:alpha-beta hydrolase superfamily lysophospholipase